MAKFHDLLKTIGAWHTSVTPIAPSCLDISWRYMLMTRHGGSATVPRRIRHGGNVQPRAAAVSGRRPGSAPQPLRASGNVPLSSSPLRPGRNYAVVLCNDFRGNLLALVWTMCKSVKGSYDIKSCKISTAYDVWFSRYPSFQYEACYGFRDGASVRVANMNRNDTGGCALIRVGRTAS